MPYIYRVRLIAFILLFAGTAIGQVSPNVSPLQLGSPNIENVNQEFVLSGKITAKKTGIPIAGASVFVVGKNQGTISDARGNYRLPLYYGDHRLRVEALGFAVQEMALILHQEATLSFELEEEVEVLDEVVVSEGLNENLNSEMIGKSRLSALETKNIPLVLGEQNILKAATILPGVSTAGEAATGFNVRGGKADQNLILLNKGIIINPNHFFGIFQAINPFVVEELNIYKGNIPIEYEGRTSSVFEMKTKAVSTEEFQGKVSVGPITANALLEAPIRKTNRG